MHVLKKTFAVFLTWCLLLTTGTAQAGEVLSLQTERDIVIVRLSEAESAQIKLGDKVLLTFTGIKEPLSGTIQDVIDGKAKIFVFEGVRTLIPQTSVSIKKRDPSPAELEDKKRTAEIEENTSKGRNAMVLGGIAFLLGGILYATADGEKSYDSCPNTTSSYQNGSAQACRDGIDSENKTKATSKLLHLIGMTAGAVTFLVGYNQYSSAEAAKNKVVSLSLKVEL
ncbi:MAG: hypothetical protein RL189_2735 [Pseudomonadota bacterium]|jgi:hypothetical protein